MGKYYLCLHHESMLYGAGERVRTVDLNLGKVALYQLSYARFTAEGRDFSYCQPTVKDIRDMMLQSYGF